MKGNDIRITELKIFTFHWVRRLILLYEIITKEFVKSTKKQKLSYYLLKMYSSNILYKIR